MVESVALNLNDPKSWNRWVIGTPPEVAQSSPFYSEQLQIMYSKNPEKKHFLEKEQEHWHTSPIEEYCLVLQGNLKTKVEDSAIDLESIQILPVPPANDIGFSTALSLSSFLLFGFRSRPTKQR